MIQNAPPPSKGILNMSDTILYIAPPRKGILNMSDTILFYIMAANQLCIF